MARLRFILVLALMTVPLAAEPAATRVTGLLTAVERARLACVEGDKAVAVSELRTAAGLLQQIVTVGNMPAADRRAAQNYLDQAQSALQTGDFNAAHNALFALQSGTVLEFGITDQNILRARRSIAAARTAAGRGNWDETSSALRLAATRLKEAARQTDPATTASLGHLSDRMLNYAATINWHNRDARKQLNQFWTELNAFITQPAAPAAVPLPADGGNGSVKPLKY